VRRPDATHQAPDRRPTQGAVGGRAERPRRRRSLERERHAFHRVKFSVEYLCGHTYRLAGCAVNERGVTNAGSPRVTVRYRTVLNSKAGYVGKMFIHPRISMASCPECGSTYVRRIARTPLMRILWTSERILCSDCGARSLMFPKLRKLVAARDFAKRQPRRPLHP
jgi:hypothetical protein